MTYKNMFGGQASTPAPVAPAPTMSRAASMFGEKPKNTSAQDIEDWKLANSHIQTPAGRILFNLHGVEVKNMTSSNINDIGVHTIGESTMASDCIENVVTMYADMKPFMEEPKTLILEATALIDRSSKRKGVLGFLSGFKQPKLTPEELRRDVKRLVDSAETQMENCVKYRLNPFIEGLADANYYVTKLMQEIDEAVNTLEYVHQRSTDATIKDLALRRKEMFVKSSALMLLNKGQLDQMNRVCEKNKAFHTELTMTIIPLLENVMRSAVLGGEDSMDEIADKMKGLL